MIDFKKSEFKFSVGLAEQLPAPSNAEIAFCGRSNVGKSSLINKLCARKSLARVSSMPGKTTTINFFSVAEGVDMVDLPGYGYAKRSDAEKKRWAQLMDEYFTSGRSIALVLLLLDSRHDPSADDMTMLNFLYETQIRFLAVLTKTDKLKKSELERNAAEIKKIIEPYSPQGVVPFSVNDPSSPKLLADAVNALLQI